MERKQKIIDNFTKEFPQKYTQENENVKQPDQARSTYKSM